MKEHKSLEKNINRGGEEVQKLRRQKNARARRKSSAWLERVTSFDYDASFEKNMPYERRRGVKYMLLKKCILT